MVDVETQRHPSIAGRHFDLDGGCRNVFLQAVQLRRPWDRHDPRLLGQEPGECDLRRRRALTLRDAAGEVRLVYYPPYHSKYNPIERCWSSLEQ